MAKSMLSDIFTSSIFSSTICKYLYKDEISNVYSSCKEIEKYILSEGMFIYKICLHIQPHGCFKHKESEHWYREGKLHRDGDQPAIIYSNGDKLWRRHGKLHRDGDQPAIIWANGDKAWYKHGIQQ